MHYDCVRISSLATVTQHSPTAAISRVVSLPLAFSDVPSQG